MDKNINLIPAKNLPIAEAEEVDVLCVENGELKRKPGASLGGSGGGYVLVISPDEIVEQTDEGMTFESKESYDNYADVLYNGGSVWVDLSALSGSVARFAVSTWSFDESFTPPKLSMSTKLVMGSMELPVVIDAKNGTWTPPTE
jgi:hypothetical protein